MASSVSLLFTLHSLWFLLSCCTKQISLLCFSYLSLVDTFAGAGALWQFFLLILAIFDNFPLAGALWQAMAAGYCSIQQVPNTPLVHISVVLRIGDVKHPPIFYYDRHNTNTLSMLWPSTPLVHIFVVLRIGDKHPPSSYFTYHGRHNGWLRWNRCQTVFDKLPPSFYFDWNNG